jgi:NAD(P)H-hydrate epimerase
VVTDGEELFENPTGNPGLATAGTGDVLAGTLVAYLARTAAFRPLRPGDALAAARRAVYVHGLAGDLAAETLGREGMIASDVIERLPAAQRRLGGS